MTSFARELWLRAEPLHAVTYFSPESAEAAKQVGFKGFWMGYYGFRAAPFGEASAAVVQATFYNFHPAHVARSLPDAWSFGSPDAALEARAASSAATLRRVVPDIEQIATELIPILAPLIEAADNAGRPLFAVNQGLRREDPVEDLWQLLTSLREHRGDGHVAALRAADLDGCEVHVVQAAANHLPDDLFQASRGWTPEDWAKSRARLVEVGIADEHGLTEAGLALKQSIEDSTDAQAARIFDGASESQRARTLELLEGAAILVRDGGVLRFPNPMGLPKPKG